MKLRLNFKMQLSIYLVAFTVISCTKDEVTEISLNKVNYDQFLGGNNSIINSSENAFSFPSPGLTGMDELNFFVGNSFFNKNWVSAPASATARDGLGPTFNAKNCSSCHFKDGRGRPASFDGELGTGLLLRFSLGEQSDGSPIHHPVYGSQLQDDAILGVEAEGQLGITYLEESGGFPDGEVYSLRKPSYFVKNPKFGSLGNIKMSPRISRQLIGLGLLEAISEEEILANEDEFDADQNGISGKANYVWDDLNQRYSLGRFGWKADQPSIIQQSSKAFLRDLGITTPLYKIDNCPDEQIDCGNAENGGTPEIDSADFDKVILYVSNLAVPAQRNSDDEIVQKGKGLFKNIGCINCHDNTMTTSSHPIFPHFNNQSIQPYSDLLLHDMGEGLADNMPVFAATGSEWRTAPLWGIGLIETVNNHTYYLHDGRARNLTEAILWHGGEAESIKLVFKSLSKSDRTALITFLESI
jgi:CxxC motif-containing protein (DUF1111 family)